VGTRRDDFDVLLLGDSTRATLTLGNFKMSVTRDQGDRLSI